MTYEHKYYIEGSTYYHYCCCTSYAIFQYHLVYKYSISQFPYCDYLVFAPCTPDASVIMFSNYTGFLCMVL